MIRKRYILDLINRNPRKFGKVLNYANANPSDRKGIIKFAQNEYGSAIGFIIGMLVIGLVVSALVGTFAYQIATAQNNSSVAAIPGGSAMLGILALLFIVIPVIVFARAAK